VVQAVVVDKVVKVAAEQAVQGLLILEPLAVQVV
jgi:hypothetical protein